MKKGLLFFMVLILTIILTGCSNDNLNKDYSQDQKKEEKIMNIEDLKKVEKIDVKYVNSKELVKTIVDKKNINEIVNIIISGKEISDDESIVFIAATYLIEMYNQDGNIIETINLYLPQETNQMIKLNNLNKYYYVNVEDILNIIN